MSFNSLSYFLFLPVVFLLFYSTGDSLRWLVLLAASFVFYAGLMQPHLLVALAGVTVVTYFAGKMIHGAVDEKRKQYLFWLGVAANLLALLSLKYMSFVGENINALSALAGKGTSISSFPALVSIGVSFYVFQAISYLIDIYLETEVPERHFGYFALYLAFFPKLLQGPIERSSDLLPQLRSRYHFEYEEVRAGLFMFGWGLFKKVVIADRLALFVDAVYGDVHAYAGLPLILATWLYAFQLYFDFSGYTDMALGTARLFNIRLTRNFNSPYLATSVADFWRRWHISFSRWILDYLFKPLQMRFRNWRKWGTACALLLTFIVSGIWHGASWGFVVWGALHGIFMAASVLYKPWQNRLHRFLKIDKSMLQQVWQIAVTFNLVCLAWVFFRAATLADAWYVLTHLFNGISPGLQKDSLKAWLLHDVLLDQSWREAAVACAGLGICLLVGVFKREGMTDISRFLHSRPMNVRWALYGTLFFSLILFAVYEKSTFIYYQF